MRLLSVFLLLGVLIAIPFLIWGDEFEAVFTVEGAAEWLHGHGDLAWLVAIVLLMCDLVLPLPSTAVLSALGFVYGTLWGGIIGSIGSVLSGSLAYWLARNLGRRAAERVAGRHDLERGERVFASVGGWVVALSRWLPLLPEVVACMAGLTRMPVAAFHWALLCGTLPMAFTFAAVGATGAQRPGVALALSAVVPVLLWPVAQALLRRKALGAYAEREADDPSADEPSADEPNDDESRVD